MNTPIMRTAQGALEYIRAMDPDTQMSYQGIRKIIASGVLNVTHLGKKKLINVSELITYLESGSPAPTPPPGIRPVPER